MKCHFCKKEISVSEKIGFREECPECYQDLHICMNCQFYDQGSYNECKETSADRVVDKEKANFCEFFQKQNETSNNEELSEADEAKRKLEELFKK